MDSGTLIDGAAVAALLAWLYLVGLHGRFWHADQRLPAGAAAAAPGSAVVALVPARDEEAVVGRALASLLEQDGVDLRIVVADDHSRDGTGDIVARAAAGAPPGRVLVTTPPPLPAGWTGKLWALRHAAAAAESAAPDARWILFTDADIAHGPGSLARLLAKAEDDGLDLASLMVRLDDRGFWGRLLMPAFVFFFQKLYPFPLANDPGRSTAAAAGGCVLIRRDALERAGGIAAIRGALIDDCALAAAVKRSGGRIWIGLADAARSLRPNGGLAGVWSMVARTAYTQLRHSPLLLAGTLVGMALVYLTAPLAVLSYPWHGRAVAAAAGLAAWTLMTVAYSPTLRLYGRSPPEGLLLPAVAALYSLMTVTSALDHWRGRGGRWKGRVYPAGG